MMLDFSNQNIAIEVTSPYDGNLVGKVPNTSISEMEVIMDTAKLGKAIMQNLPAYEVSSIIEKTATYIKKNHEQFAQTITKEAGKTIKQARKEVDRTINTLQLSVMEVKKNSGEVIKFDSFEGGENRQGYYQKFPLGIVLAITPFNDPLNLVAHKLGPSLAAKNSVILKPSKETPLSSFLLAEAFYKSGLPKEALQVCVGTDGITQELVKNRQIRAISFTGGNATAQKITQQAGIKKMIMDLGGNAPVIVMSDCDLEQSVKLSVAGSFWAAGQNCISSQRILIHIDIYEEFKSKFIELASKLKILDPMDEKCDMGPMINISSAKNIEQKVNDAIKNGAKLLLGNKRENSTYYPTILESVDLSCAIRRDEVFAPVVILQPINNLDEAIKIANESEVSLQTGIFTNNLKDALRAANEIEAGGVMINDSSDYRLDSMPFGGFKYGSMGREGVSFAYEELSQTKVICFNVI